MSSRYTATFLASGVLMERIRWCRTLAVHPPLLASLEKHFPNLKLSVEGSNLTALRTSPLTRSLRVPFESRKLETTKISPLLTNVQTQIVDSPNIVELSMKVDSLGCDTYGVDLKFARLEGKRFPPLEQLTLEAFPLTVENVAYWMENMDLSRMRNIDLRAIDEPTHFFNEATKVAGGLPRLRKLRMELPWFCEARDMRKFEIPSVGSWTCRAKRGSQRSPRKEIIGHTFRPFWVDKGRLWRSCNYMTSNGSVSHKDALRAGASRSRPMGTQSREYFD